MNIVNTEYTIKVIEVLGQFSILTGDRDRNMFSNENETFKRNI